MNALLTIDIADLIVLVMDVAIVLVMTMKDYLQKSKFLLEILLLLDLKLKPLLMKTPSSNKTLRLTRLVYASRVKYCLMCPPSQHLSVFLL